MTDDDGSRWLTYEDAAEALGIDAGSVKRRAQRANWPRMTGNDRRTLVAVPASAFPAEGATSGDVSPAPDPLSTMLDRALEAERSARADLEVERTRRIALEAAMAVLIAEAKFLSRRGLAARIQRIADYRYLSPAGGAHVAD